MLSSHLLTSPLVALGVDRYPPPSRISRKLLCIYRLQTAIDSEHDSKLGRFVFCSNRTCKSEVIWAVFCMGNVRKEFFYVSKCSVRQSDGYLTALLWQTSIWLAGIPDRCPPPWLSSSFSAFWGPEQVCPETQRCRGGFALPESLARRPAGFPGWLELYCWQEPIWRIHVS